MNQVSTYASGRLGGPSEQIENFKTCHSIFVDVYTNQASSGSFLFCLFEIDDLSEDILEDVLAFSGVWFVGELVCDPQDLSTFPNIVLQVVVVALICELCQPNLSAIKVHQLAVELSGGGLVTKGTRTSSAPVRMRMSRQGQRDRAKDRSVPEIQAGTRQAQVVAVASRTVASLASAARAPPRGDHTYPEMM